MTPAATHDTDKCIMISLANLESYNTVIYNVQQTAYVMRTDESHYLNQVIIDYLYKLSLEDTECLYSIILFESQIKSKKRGNSTFSIESPRLGYVYWCINRCC